MSILEQIAFPDLPEYTPTMYMNYSPVEVYVAAKRKFYEDAERRKEDQEDELPFNVNFKSEVKIKR